MSLEIIRPLYDQHASLPVETTYYEQLLENKDILKVAPQIYSLLKEKGRLEQTPQLFQEKLKERFSQTLYLNMFIKSELQNIYKAFEQLGIDVIPLKGVHFAERYFGHLGARPTSDIDLLVEKSELNRAIECIKSLGFTIHQDDIEGHFHTSFSKIQTWSQIPLTVELHWTLIEESKAELGINEFWANAQPIESFNHVKELSEYHTFYMICVHGWRHNLDSLKYYLDIIQVIFRAGDEINYDKLIGDASRHKTLKRMIRTLSIVYQECPFVEDLKSFSYKKAANYLEFEDKKRSGNKNIKRYLDFIDYQFLSYDSPTHSFKELVKWVKPKS